MSLILYYFNNFFLCSAIIMCYISFCSNFEALFESTTHVIQLLIKKSLHVTVSHYCRQSWCTFIRVKVLIEYNNHPYSAALMVFAWCCVSGRTHHAVYTTTEHMVLSTEYLEVTCTLESSSSFTDFEVTYLHIAFLNCEFINWYILNSFYYT